MSKFVQFVEPGASLEFRAEIPKDVIPPKFAKDIPFKGDIYCNSEGKYYSRAGGMKYRPKHEGHHLNTGHFQGFSFAIEHYSPEFGIVIDPFVGSGTACIEAHLQERTSIGIELEYDAILDKNMDHIYTLYPRLSDHHILTGDCSKVLRSKAMEPYLGSVDLAVTGFPYPAISQLTSDKPMREDQWSDQTYFKEESFGLLKLNKTTHKGNFLFKMREVLEGLDPLLKTGGFFCTIIKDPTIDKEPFPLQDIVTQDLIDRFPNYKPHSWFCHKHLPTTMFMNTYPKRFPDVPIPLYQIGLVLQKT